MPADTQGQINTINDLYVYQQLENHCAQSYLSSTCGARAADDPWRLLFWESPRGSAASHTCESVCPSPSSADPVLAADLLAAEQLAAGWLPAAAPPVEPAGVGQVQVQ